MALPWIIGGLAVATVAYLATDDDSSSSSSDRYDREREAKERAKEEKNEKILEEIKDYKNTQKKKIKNKYGTIIDFNKTKEIKIVSKDMQLEDKIKLFKKEKNELKEIIKNLELKSGE